MPLPYVIIRVQINTTHGGTRMSQPNVSTDDCWLFAGSKNRLGYGFIYRDGEVYRAHRVMYENYVGAIPEGTEPDHLCSSPPCINPSHLEAVDHITNVMRGRSPQAQNAWKTHCSNGHEFTPENTYWRKGVNKDSRECLACRKIWHNYNWRERYKE